MKLYESEAFFKPMTSYKFYETEAFLVNQDF